MQVTDETRASRGWVYDEKKDTDQTETGLDGFNFDTVFDNDADGQTAVTQWANRELLPRLATTLC